MSTTKKIANYFTEIVVKKFWRCTVLYPFVPALRSQSRFFWVKDLEFVWFVKY